jgi:acyl-CoA thioesterase-2
MTASLDHVMWFHRPCRADEWLLYHCHSPWAGAARGFTHGQVFRRDGTVCATIAQEGLVRPLR